tara:strand:- start:3111 stop:3392 length:282 start_codon:yes stop_codon:yes gene_type:complete
MERQHQRVRIIEEDKFLEFKTALAQRERLIQLKASIESDLYDTQQKIKGLTCAIEQSCDHDWCNETNYSAGEKERWCYCKICGKISGGRDGKY